MFHISLKNGWVAHCQINILKHILNTREESERQMIVIFMITFKGWCQYWLAILYFKSVELNILVYTFLRISIFKDTGQRNRELIPWSSLFYLSARCAPPLSHGIFDTTAIFHFQHLFFQVSRNELLLRIRDTAINIYELDFLSIPTWFS